MSEIAGVLLAGGQARRMGGGDKCLRELAGRSLLAHVVERARPQIGRMVINANGDPTRFQMFDLPVVGDVVAGFAGPLAGILTGMHWARAHVPEARWVLSIATDTPFFPKNLAQELKLAALRDGLPLACAASGGRSHPVFGLWSLELADALEQAVVVEGVRKIDAWTARYGIAQVDFASEPFDPFFNANRQDDLAEAERLYQALHSI